MARATSASALSKAKREAGHSYRAELVFAYRAFQLKESAQTAGRLLALMPTDEEQQTIVLTLGDSLCSGESGADNLALSRVNEGLARALAKAVLLVRVRLPSYVSYAIEAIGDPHSDYAPPDAGCVPTRT